MPVYEVEGPDGGVYEVEAANEAAALGAFTGKKPTSQALGFAKGFIDPYHRLEARTDANPLTSALVTGLTHRTTTPEQRAATREGTADWLTTRAARPGGIGETAGSITAALPMLAMGGPLTSGAVGGAFLSKGDNLQDVAVDAGLGAVGGKIGDKVFRGLGAAIAPRVDPAIAMMREAGVRLSPGQAIPRLKTLEDKATSIPFVGEAINRARTRSLDDFNRGAVDMVLHPIGAKLPKNISTGHDAVAFAQEALQEGYERILPQVQVRPDAKFAATLRSAGKHARELTDEGRKQLQTILANVIRHDGTGTLSGRQWQDATSDLGQRASELAGGSSAERTMGRALGAVRTALVDAAERQNPTSGVRELGKAYKRLTRVEMAARGADDGVFSTGQLKTAVRQGDRTVRKRATAAGKAEMQEYSNAARKVLPSRVPDSGSAGRLGLMNLPLALGVGVPGLVGFQGAKLAASALSRNAGPAAKQTRALLEQLAPVGRIGGFGLFGGNRP